MKKRFLGLLLALLPLAAVSCTSKFDGITVGILLPQEHGALNNAKDGFIEALSEGGYSTKAGNLKVIVKNAQGNADDQKTMAKSLMSKCDLTLGIGTGAATDLKSAQFTSGKTSPVLFTAVTDPVDAGLVNSLEAPGGNITGTSDAQPIDAQIELIKECIPNVDKIGVFYTETESNSQVQAIQAKEAIEKIGASCVIKTCKDSTDVATAVTALAQTEGLDAIYIPTDNNVAANMGVVLNNTASKGILLVGGEENQLNAGAHITLSINYTELGKRTGKMGVQILNGENTPSEIPVVTMTKDECEYVMNSDNLATSKIEIPQTIKDQCRDLGTGK